MIGALGQLAISLALALVVAGAVASFVSRSLPSLEVWARRAAVAVLAFVALAVILMEIGLLTHDFSISYVAEVGGPSVSPYFTIISLWAALKGSILFWALLLSVYTVVFLHRYRVRFAEILPFTRGILLLISTFFLFVIAGPGNPFTTVNPVVACRTACIGPNPLLQNNWMMGVHPQLLYLGYVGLSVPFAITMASLLRVGGPTPDVMRLIRRWTLIPWIFLSFGVVGGMWWSYAVLGWGGYWSWDPVENVAVMPWLVTTAFLHSVQVQERRQMLKTWTLSLVVAAFLLSILGTFLTRSGVLPSVHSFTQSAVGPIFLAFFAVCLVGSVALLLIRSRDLAASGYLEASVCRETAFLFNNLLLVAITFTILLGTLFPLIAEALQGTRLSVGAPYFNHVAVPIGFALLFLMGVGPVLPWGAARAQDVQYRLLGPVAIGVGVFFLLLLAGVRGPAALVTFATAAFVMAVTVGRPLADIRGRRRNTGDGWASATRRLVAANPRRYGGYLAHIGVLLAVIGIAASQTYQVRALSTLRPGQSASVDGYQLRYLGWSPHSGTDGSAVIQARVGLRRDGRQIGSLSPAETFYPAVATPVVTPGVREEPWSMFGSLWTGDNPLPDLMEITHGRNPFEDVYVVLVSVTRSPSGPATLQILVNPLVGFIWLGGILLGLGGITALIPGKRRRTRTSALEVTPRLLEEAAV